MLRVLLYVAVPVIVATVYLALLYVASRSVYFPAKYPEGLWDAQAPMHAADVSTQRMASAFMPGGFRVRAPLS